MEIANRKFNLKTESRVEDERIFLLRFLHVLSSSSVQFIYYEFRNFSMFYLLPLFSNKQNNLKAE